MWTREKLLKLIELFHATPALWSLRSEEYKNKNTRAASLLAVATELNSTVEEVERKIKSLRTQFKREFNRKVERELNGSEATETEWFAYSYLTFLSESQYSSRKALKRAKEDSINDVYISNVMSCNDWAPEPQQKETSTTKPAISILKLPVTPKSENFVVPFKKPNRLQNTNTEHVDETCECLLKVQETVEQKDDYSVYGENVAIRLRNAAQGNRAMAIAKHRIDNILFKLEMGMYADS